MSILKLRSFAQRGSMLTAVAAIVIASVAPAASVFADALNPLTERSLLLTSSAPGFIDTDGSGNSADAPNSIGENYAPAGSGPNGRKTGETFTFRVSSTAGIKAFTLQYCTTAAGICQAPGNNTGDAHTITDDREDNGPDEVLLGHSDLEFVGAWTQGTGAGQFQILTNTSPKGVGYDPDAFAPIAGTWTLAADNKEDQSHPDPLTGKDNFVTLASTTGDTISADTQVRIVFNPSESVYITNPGADEFFVKLNTYNTDTTANHIPGNATYNVDGGVTVANVMTDSIHITTKVLETMSFSVGTQNPDTQAVQHGSCDPIVALNNNRLNLGNPSAEYSLETGKAWDVFSYWRLSSNSSGGASVYYSGDTLRNTVGDEISEIGARAHSQIGTEQFGLAVIDAGADTMDGGTFPANHITPSVLPLAREAAYTGGGAQGDNDISSLTTADNAEFAFFKSSNTVPELIAQNNDTVISCATAKMRYVANIAADTPAGVYTTKVNYLAAPQY